MNGGEVLAYTAHTAPGGLWLLDREDYVTEGQKYTKQYSFDSSGRISQEKVRYQNSGACNHLINVTADYAYQNDSPARVTFKGGYDGFSAEGSPTLRWDATLAYISDPQGRIEREDFAVTSYVKTYMTKPTGPNREDAWKLYPSMRLKKPHDVSRLGDLCAMAGTKLVGNQIDLRPFYTLSPNLNMLLPFGVTRVTVTFTYPENFSLRTASGG